MTLIAITHTTLGLFPFLAVNTGPGTRVPNVPRSVPGLLGHTPLHRIHRVHKHLPSWGGIHRDTSSILLARNLICNSTTTILTSFFYPNCQSVLLEPALRLGPCKAKGHTLSPFHPSRSKFKLKIISRRLYLLPPLGSYHYAFLITGIKTPSFPGSCPSGNSSLLAQPVLQGICCKDMCS